MEGGTRQSSTKQQPLRDLDVDQNMPSVDDRLSTLQDNLLCHILSFLPTKLSVSTSILAKRWRFVWAHVPILDFYGLSGLRDPTRFESIINEVLLLHKKPTINTLRLQAHDYCRMSKFKKWIATAIERNVQTLELCASDYDISYQIFMWPLPLFNCKTLVHLKLIGYTLPRFNGLVSLPSLKKLFFEGVEFSVDEAIPHLLPGCPVLDELSFSFDLFDFCDVSIDIRRLTTYNYSRWVKIEVYSLNNIQLVDRVFSHISARMLTSLVEAKVEIFTQIEDKDLQHFIPMFIRLLDRLCKVKRLELSLAQVFSFEIQPVKRFDNCTRLEMAVDWAFLMKFLESADNLQVLIIPNVCADFGNWIEPKQVPTCLLSCLETVQIKRFECTQPEFEMVRYFLTNAKVLKRMEIQIMDKLGLCFRSRLDAVLRLALFRRGSEACELACAFC